MACVAALTKICCEPSRSMYYPDADDDGDMLPMHRRHLIAQRLAGKNRGGLNLSSIRRKSEKLWRDKQFLPHVDNSSNEQYGEDTPSAKVKRTSAPLSINCLSVALATGHDASAVRSFLCCHLLATDPADPVSLIFFVAPGACGDILCPDLVQQQQRHRRQVREEVQQAGQVHLGRRLQERPPHEAADSRGRVQQKRPAHLFQCRRARCQGHGLQRVLRAGSRGTADNEAPPARLGRHGRRTLDDRLEPRPDTSWRALAVQS